MLLRKNYIYPNVRFIQYKPLYDRDLLFKLLNCILTNGANATRIKAIIAKIWNKEIISKDEKKDKIKDVIDL